MLRNYWEIEMHASAVVSEVTVRALFELFLIIWWAEDREAYRGFPPSVWYKVIADCPLEEATIIKLQLLKPFNQVLSTQSNTGSPPKNYLRTQSRPTLDHHHAFSSIQRFFLAIYFSQLVAFALDSSASRIGYI